MSLCEACIKAEDIQKLILEIALLKNDMKECKENNKILLEKDAQRSTDQALIIKELAYMNKAFDEFTNKTFKDFVDEFKSNQKKPGERWNSLITFGIGAVVAGLVNIIINKLSGK